MDVDEAALRAQLTGGTPPERVVAAWELALRLGGAVAGELRQRLDREASVGARRHLVVVLAGLGERDALRAIAAHDVDSRVRATAVRYVAHVSHDAAERDRFLAERLAGDDAADVALAILDVAGTATEPLVVALTGLLAHPSVEVRVAIVARYETTEAPVEVLARAITEPVTELRGRLAWLAFGRDASVLSRLDDDTMRVVLMRAAREGHRVPWTTLGSWATRHGLALNDAELVLDVLEEPFDAVPLSPVLRLLTQSYTHGSSGSVLDRILDRCERARLEDADRAALITLAEPFLPSSLRDEVHQGLRTEAALRVARIRKLVAA